MTTMKKQIEYLHRLFYDIWNDFGKVYLHVNYSERTIIGRRGFTDEEKRQGVVFVFNARTNENMVWDEEGNVSCVLAFGTRKEDIFIHHDDLRGVFSPDAGVQYVRSDLGGKERSETEQGARESGEPQVVSLSRFKRRKETGKT